MLSTFAMVYSRIAAALGEFVLPVKDLIHFLQAAMKVFEPSLLL